MNTTVEKAFCDPFQLDLAACTLPQRSGRTLGDRGVRQLHTALQGENILLVVTAGIAAYKTPGLVRMLRSFGAAVDVRLTEKATEFIGRQSLEWAVESGVVSSGSALTGDVEHLRPYSTYLVAPASYDFINGMAEGRADNPALTTMAAALGRVAAGRAKMLVLPCMNGDMANLILMRNIEKLSALGVKFIPPRTQNGKLEYPGSEFVTVAAARHASQSPLRGLKVLLTGGPTPVPLDDVRILTNIFKGKLGIELAKELTIRGANPAFLLGGSLGVPDYLKPFTRRYRNYDEYRDLVLQCGANFQPQLAVLSAAVADYRPKTVYEGKIASKSDEVVLPPLVPTEKVVELLHDARPELPIISFKLLSRVSEEALLTEARVRLTKHSVVVVANRLEDCDGDTQTVHLVTSGGTVRVEGTKRQVASAIVDAMESFEARRRAHHEPLE